MGYRWIAKGQVKVTSSRGCCDSWVLASKIARRRRFFQQKANVNNLCKRRPGERAVRGVHSRFSDAAEPNLYRDTWRGIPGTAQGRITLSRDERVRCSAMAESRVTRGRQRCTDCYPAIQVAGIIPQLLRGSCWKH